MDLSAFEARCEECAALCCVVPEFAAGDRFPEAKPGRVPCEHLKVNGCGIYPEREARGYRGCIAFTCRGAGPAVTQDLFGGRSWREDLGQFIEAMAQAFFRVFRVQEARFMLVTMAFSGLSAERNAEREAMLADMDPGGPWTLRRLAEIETACPPERVRAWMAAGFTGGSPD